MYKCTETLSCLRTVLCVRLCEFSRTRGAEKEESGYVVVSLWNVIFGALKGTYGLCYRSVDICASKTEQQTNVLVRTETKLFLYRE